MDTSKRHFHTLDALRFFSFLIVFFHHIPVPENSWFYVFTKSGNIGVSFFFVLSGFLITYILLYEKTKHKTINLKNFFAKRILKIWPLFYALLLFAFLTPFFLKLLKLSYSNIGYEPNWLMSIFFMENYYMMFTGSFPNVSPLRVMWSLCIEEHFYILWGLLFAFVPIHKLKYVIVISILISAFFRGIYYHLNIPFLDLLTNLDYFAYGAIPAYALFFKNELLLKVEKISFNIKIVICCFTLLMVFGISNLKHEWLNLVKPIVFGTLFALIITFVITEKKSIQIKDSLWISKLGIYTYGLYLYHTIILNLFMRLGKNFNWNWVEISVFSFITTVFVSIFSYYLFEKQFLKLKKHFS
ncbi:acyltransferase family protein [Flavobacterium sp.]|jgi:peptidoglycan/LPS O-acetylase OafA/YrhL|uniref:acyltransferase family protein n=1 Tax=Flavobacterium sp. TaxID=239 RepID=UPI004047F289